MSMLDKAKELYGKAKEKVVAAKEWVQAKSVQLGVALTGGYVAVDTLLGDAAQALDCPTGAGGAVDATSLCSLAKTIDFTDIRYAIFIVAGGLILLGLMIYGGFKLYGMFQRR